MPCMRQAAQAGPDALRGLLSTVLTGEAAVWLADLDDEIDLTVFQAAFLERFGSMVRFKRQEARQALYEHKVVQRKAEAVGDYYVRFMAVVKQAEDMSVSDQISWFIHGLHPDLVGTCAVQTNGQPWTDLKALVNFALGEEARLKATKAASHRATLSRIARTQAQAPTPRPGGSLPKQGGGTKKPPSSRPAEDGFEAVQKKKAFRPKVDPAKWGPPDAPNAKNPRISNAEAARRISEGICIHCGQKGGHAPGCPRGNRQKQQ